MPPRPSAGDAAPYYFTYIDKVGQGDIRHILAGQLEPTLAVLAKVSEEKSLYRYAPGKWSLREALNHITDTERIFAHRALWFARGFESPLAGFDQDVAVHAAGADAIPWADHVEEFRLVRLATVSLFENMPEAAFGKRGVASDNPVTVNGLAYILAGHVAHHMGIIEQRYF